MPAPNAHICDGTKHGVFGGGAIEDLSPGVNSTTVVLQTDIDAGRVWRVCAGGSGMYVMQGTQAELTANTGRQCYCPANEVMTLRAVLGESVKVSATSAGDTTAFNGGPLSAIPANNRYKIAWVGDSFVQHESAFATGLAGIVETSNKGMINWVNTLSGAPWALDATLSNFGISGGTSVQVLAAVPAIIAYGPDICFVQGGHNDFIVGSSMATVIAAKSATFQQLKAAGITPVAMMDIPTLTNESSTFVTLTVLNQMVADLNSWLVSYCQKNQILLWDIYTPYVDPASTTAAPKTGYINADNIHPTAIGSYAIAKYAIANKILASIIPPKVVRTTRNQIDYFDSVNNLRGNLLAKSFWVSASITGGVFAPWTTGAVGPNPGSWTLNGAAITGGTLVSTIVAAADGRGFVLRNTFTGLTSASSLSNANMTPPGVNAGGTTFQAGDVLEGWVDFAVSGATKINNIQMTLQLNDGTSVFQSVGVITNDVGQVDTAFSGTVYLPPVKVNAYAGSGTQKITCVITISFDGTGGGASGVVDIQQPTVRKVLA